MEPKTCPQCGQPMTYVLSSATGRLTHTLPEVTEFQVADCNGDGIGDLIYRVAPQGASRLVVRAARLAARQRRRPVLPRQRRQPEPPSRRNSPTT